MTAWRRHERIGDCDLYLGDCLEVMPELGRFDAVVTDPPYGIGEAAGKSKTRTSGFSARKKGSFIKDYGEKSWDDKTMDTEIDAARMQSDWQIIFGGNYYDLPPTSCWLIWDKLNGETDFADCEMAWTNLPKAVRRITYLWNGAIRKERHTARVHPTQKPVGVIKWCIGHLPLIAETILDPFMGSGTTGVACVQLGRKFTGIELDPDYFDIACERIAKAVAEPRLPLDEPKAKPEQFNVLEDSE
jgi:DNA modification methylase